MGTTPSCSLDLLQGVRASSELQVDRYPGRYGATKAVDGESATAWGTERGLYLNEWIELSFSREVTVTSIDLQTGFNAHHEQRDLFAINRRIKRARVDVGADHESEQSFPDRRGWHTIAFDPPVISDMVKLTVLEIYEGSRWPDLHVSEIRVWGHRATTTSKRLSSAKHYLAPAPASPRRRAF